ncbi:MAG: hypothetical protein U0414_36855 [Polyangiaceae bacterium]
MAELVAALRPFAIEGAAPAAAPVAPRGATQVLDARSMAAPSSVPRHLAPATAAVPASDPRPTGPAPAVSVPTSSLSPARGRSRAPVLAAGALAVALAGGAAVFFAVRGGDPAGARAPKARAARESKEADSSVPEGATKADRAAAPPSASAPLAPAAAATPPPPSAIPTATQPNVEWAKRLVPDLSARDGAARIESAGWSVRETNEEHLETFDRFTYRVEGFNCTGNALFFRFKTVADTKQIEQGMGQVPGYRVLRTDTRFVQIMLVNLTAGAAASPACTDSVADALTRPL